MIKTRSGDCSTVRTKISGSGSEGFDFQTIKILLVLFCSFARQVVIYPSHPHNHRARVWLTESHGSLTSKPRFRSVTFATCDQTMGVAIDGKTCALNCLNSNAWCFGVFSYYVLNLGAAVGAMHWIGLRCFFSLQRLRHHLAAQNNSALFAGH